MLDHLHRDVPGGADLAVGDDELLGVRLLEHREVLRAAAPPVPGPGAEPVIGAYAVPLAQGLLEGGHLVEPVTGPEHDTFTDRPPTSDFLAPVKPSASAFGEPEVSGSQFSNESPSQPASPAPTAAVHGAVTAAVLICGS
ncbi:hypothetical protein ACFVH6_09525 [Spirillospora sp. NPDC127200]